jgi:hypothetical protein
MKQAHIMVVTQRGVGLWLGRKEEEKEEEKLVCLLRALIKLVNLVWTPEYIYT